jgi:hypothetical protein
MVTAMIKISYAGTLAYFNPEMLETGRYWRKWLLTYRHNEHLSNTRTAYYIFKALTILNKDIPDLSSRLSFHLWGDIHPGNQKMVKEMKLEKIVHISGTIPRSETLNKLSSSDVLFLPLEMPAEQHRSLFIPGKLFEYLQIGKPILMLGEDSDSADILKRSGLGLFAPQNEAETIAELLKRIVIDPAFLVKLVPDTSYIESLHVRYRVAEIAEVFRRLSKNKDTKL